MGRARTNAHHAYFERKRRGYDCDAVDAHLEQMSARYDKVCRECDDLSARLNEFEQTLDGYRGLEQQVGNAFLVAEGAAATVREKAQAESDEIIAQARLRAEEIVGDSRTEHSQLLEDVENLRALRSELVSSYTAFLLSALELVEEHREARPPENHLEEKQSESDAKVGAESAAERHRVAQS